MAKLNIAIDGPAGAGKSTVARIISEKLGILYLDTGAMYRAVALKVINSNVSTTDCNSITEIVEDINIKIKFNGKEQIILLDDEDVTEKIRTKEISIGASNVGTIPRVREKMVELQREIASDNSVVMDGRDIGSYVLPNANYKFYLTASLDERAKRRYNEYLQKGVSDTDLNNVKKDIEYRDQNDMSREFAPLCKAKDAIEIDSTSIDVHQVVERILKYIG